MSTISIDNGHSNVTVESLTDEQIHSVIEHIESGLGGDELRESVHGDLAPCSEREFVEEFCRRFSALHVATFTIG